VANPLHHAALAALLRGEALPGRPYAAALKLLLDAGFAPTVAARVPDPAPEGLVRAVTPLLAHLGLHPVRLRSYLDASHVLLRAGPLPSPAPGPPAPLLTVAPSVSAAPGPAATPRASPS